MGPSAHEHVDVLVVNFRTGDLTRSALASVNGPGVHAWVWDNSGELLVEPEHGLPAATTLLGSGRNTFYAPANNALYDRCDGEWVLLLNPDVQLTWAALQELVAAGARHPRAWGLAPRLLNADGTDQHYLQRLPTSAALLADRIPPLRRWGLRRTYARFMADDVDLRAEQRVDQPPAACLLVRRSAMGERLFDPSYRLFFNDTDLARRHNRHGDCWLVPDITATHLRGESFRREERRSGFAVAREYDRTLLRYARKNLRGWIVLAPVIGLRLAIAWTLDRARGAANLEATLPMPRSGTPT